MLPSLCPSFVSPFFAILHTGLEPLAVSSQTAPSPGLLKNRQSWDTTSILLLISQYASILFVNFFIPSEITASLSFSTLFMYVFSFYHRSLCKYSLYFSLFLNVKETDRIFRAICLFSHLFYNSVSIFPDGFSSKLFLKNFTEAPHLPRPACRPASSY